MITLLGLQFSTVELILAGGLLLAILLAIAILVKMPKKDSGEEAGRTMPAAVQSAPMADEDEIVAVLAAAVAAATGMAAGDFRIASYQQLSPAKGRSAWSKAGRREQMSRSF